MKVNLTLTYSAVGHAFMHMFTAFYFVIVLAIEKYWQAPYEELLRLWFLGSLLVGIAALPAGWISDKWSRSGMMAVMFLGMGLSSLLCGLSINSNMLFVFLTFLGLFAAIYHPVAIAWVVNNSKKKGMALGINGVFGTAGVGAGGIVAGLLIKIGNWQTAFIVPGVLSILIGFFLLYHLKSKKIAYRNSSDIKKTSSNTKSQTLKIALIFLVSVFCLGLTFQIIQTSVPKLLEIRLSERLNLQTSGIGGLVAIIYCISGISSLLGGYLADRYNLKHIYICGILLQAPFLFLVSQVYHSSLIAFLLLVVLFNTSILPAENILLANLAPQKYHGLIYGCKFILAFGSAPVAVLLVSKFYELYREFIQLFILAGCLLIGVFCIALLLPIRKTAETT